MISQKTINYNDFLGHHTLLYGETNTNKTLLTSNFVKFLLTIKEINPKEISILDFAPKLESIHNIKIGGKIVEYYAAASNCNLIFIEKEIIPPRLNAKNKDELFRNACNNYKETYLMLKKFNANPTKILIMNDVSIFLHLGSQKYLLETISKSETFFGNSYYGSSIKQPFAKLFCRIEQNKVEFLIKNIEFTYKTTKEV